MKKYPSLIGLAAASLACIVALTACSSGSPTLRYVSITPQTATISATTTQQFTAQAFYSDGTSKDATTAASWASSNTAVATITSAGVATGVTNGTSTISATYLGASATAALNVNLLQSITVTPATVTVAAGATQQFTAMGKFKNSDGSTSTSDVTSMATWMSSTTGVATINATGLATAGTTSGTTTITATLDGVSGTAALSTGAPVPLSLQVSPATPSAPIGGSVQFSAVELWSDGSTHTPSGSVTFASNATGVLSVLSTGASSALTVGSAMVTATEGSLTGNTTVTVTAGVTKFAYVSNVGDSDVQWYTVTAANAAPLVSGGTTTKATQAPVQTIVHPSGKFLYEIESGSGSISQVHVYTISTTTPGQPVDSGLPLTTFGQGNSNFGAIDPYGRYLYVLDSGNPSATPTATLGSLYAFSINPGTGALTLIGSGPITTGLDFPFCIVMDRTGSYVYVVNQGLNSSANANTLNAYQIGATGALTPLGTASYPTGLTPAYATIDPSGSHIYVANNGDGTVTGYTVTKSTGALTPMTPATITGTANHVLNLAVDPSNKYLYVLDAGNPGPPTIINGQVFGYVLNSDGTIPSTAISGTPIPAGPLPTGIAIDISGTLLAVDNGGDGVNPSTISLYTLTPSSGALTAKSPATVGAGLVPTLVTFYNAAQ